MAEVAEALVLLLRAVDWLLLAVARLLLAVARLPTVDIGIWLVAVDLLSMWLLSLRLLAVSRRRLLSMRLLAVSRRRLLTVAWRLAIG